MIIMGIYKIINPIEEIYIGQSIDILDRWNNYNKLYCEGQPKLYNSFLKYGPENHIFEILEECPEDRLDELETWWKYYYGVQCVENGLCYHYIDGKGGKRSKETKQKISNSHKGKKRIFTEKHKENIRKSAKIKNKVNFNENWKRKLSESIKKSPNRVSKIKENSYKCKIIQYDLNMNFIKEWDSIKEARISTKITSIQDNLKNRTKSAGGYVWLYKNDLNLPNSIELVLD